MGAFISIVEPMLKEWRKIHLLPVGDKAPLVLLDFRKLLSGNKKVIVEVR